jgi:hypothetical protein
MMLEISQNLTASLEGFGRTPSQQALENLAQALRALDLAPRSDSDLCPHPLTVVRAEIENARRYLNNGDTSHQPLRRRPQSSTRRSKCDDSFDEMTLPTPQIAEITVQLG